MTPFLSRLVDLAVAIQQIPAPTLHEEQRAEFVQSCFIEEQLLEVEKDPVGNVYACLPADPAQVAGRAPLVVVSAHLDTVFPMGTDLKVGRQPGRIYGAGIGDNAMGVAGLLGLVWELRHQRRALPVDLWLVANVCEEGLGDLRGMKAVVERFGDKPAAYIALEGMALGLVFHRALGVRRYRITICTQGGHSWVDYGQPSAVHELASLATRIAGLKMPCEPRTTINVGTISGGTSVNTIASQASFELDLRSEQGEMLESVAAQVEAMVAAASGPGVQATVEMIGQRPTGMIPADHPLVELAQDCLRQVQIEPHLIIGSTDANIPLSLGLPAVTIGLTTGGGAHTNREYIHTEPLSQGIAQAVNLVASISPRAA